MTPSMVISKMAPFVTRETSGNAPGVGGRPSVARHSSMARYSLGQMRGWSSPTALSNRCLSSSHRRTATRRSTTVGESEYMLATRTNFGT